MISKKFLKILMVCFYINILAIIVFVSSPLIFIALDPTNINFKIVRLIQVILYLPVWTIWLYCIYFYYKYDKYSSSGLKLFFLAGVYSPFYFYKIIWKRKRDLINTYKSEPVLGSSIHIETED